jgi:biopolymer transport protein ExbD
VKFPRNARIFRGQLDAAPFVSVFFLLVAFVILGSRLYIPGIPLELPSTGDLNLPGTDQPTVSVAVTSNALYFEDQLVSESELSNRLVIARQNISPPPTLVVEEDKDVPHQRLIRLAIIAKGAGLHNVQIATLPRAFESPDGTSSHP